MARSGRFVLAGVLILAACAGDEHDRPDRLDTRPLGSITAPPPASSADVPAEPTEPGDVPGSTHGGDSPVCDGSAPTPAELAGCSSTSSATVATTPATLPRCEDPDDATDPDEAPCVP